ncbi:MAG: HAD family hydrolase [Clostridiales bacterium]|nr:HAD family hydrolase [Clostridiales bacterium]
MNKKFFEKFEKKHKWLVCIDSDGCVFDTMELKHKECFTPAFIKCFRLQSVSKYAREVSEYVYLYSKTRGTNRFLALVKMLQLLKKREEVKRRNVYIPDIEPLIKWIELGNPTSQGLKLYLEKHPDIEVLIMAYDYSLTVNCYVDEIAHGVQPFYYVPLTLGAFKEFADIAVISATPTETIIKEWQTYDIAKYADIICGQEFGTKTECISELKAKSYESNNILMIGDAPGDYKAAKDNNVLFAPINPGDEENSWERLYREGIDAFLNGKYQGDYENRLVAEFDLLLSSEPPWARFKK